MLEFIQHIGIQILIQGSEGSFLKILFIIIITSVYLLVPLELIYSLSYKG